MPHARSPITLASLGGGGALGKPTTTIGTNHLAIFPFSHPPIIQFQSIHSSKHTTSLSLSCPFPDALSPSSLGSGSASIAIRVFYFSEPWLVANNVPISGHDVDSCCTGHNHHHPCQRVSSLTLSHFTLSPWPLYVCFPGRTATDCRYGVAAFSIDAASTLDREQSIPLVSSHARQTKVAASLALSKHP